MTREQLADQLSLGVRRRRLERLHYSQAEIDEAPVAFEGLPDADQQTWLDTADTVLELLPELGPLDDDGAIAMLNAVLAWAREDPEYHMDGKATGQNYQRGRIVATDVVNDGTVGASTYKSAADAREKAIEMERAYRNWLLLKGPRRRG